MTAIKKDLYIEQGTTFRMGFTWTKESATTPGTAGVPYDLTYAIARMQVRKTQQQPVIVDATSIGPLPKLVLGGANGRIDLCLTDEDTDLIAVKAAVYDLEVEMSSGGTIVGGGDTFRLLQGAITMSPNVTQAVGGVIEL